MTRSTLPLRRLAAVALLLAASVPATAQIPDEFTNLKVLDPEIGRSELVAVMRGFAGGLGVRCNHCHVGPDNLEGMDFATDEKQTKRAARVMLEMTREINARYVGSWLPAGEQSDPGVPVQTVSCFTCHRGQSKPPQRLAKILAETLRAEGAAAAAARYQELRSEYADRGVYDFRESVFADAARAAFAAGDLEAGTALLREALALFPASADLHFYLGMFQMEGGDLDGAVASFDRALEIDPGNPAALRGKAAVDERRAGAGEEP